MLACWQRVTRSARVLRFDLQPLTLGHVFLLAEADSVFVSGKSTEDPIGALALAVFVCSQSPESARRGMAAWWAERFFRVWAWSCRNCDYESEAEKFTDWFQEQVAGPETDGKGDGKKMGTPWHMNIFATLVGEVGVDVDAAKRMTVREARQLICALGEARGQCNVVTEESVDYMDAIDFWSADRKAKGMTLEQYTEHLRQEERN